MRRRSERLIVAVMVVIADGVMLAIMGRPVVFLVGGLTLAYGLWLVAPPIDPRRVLPAYALAIIAQLLHLFEENRAGFYREFPKVLGAQPWEHSIWLTFNIVWLLVFAAAALGLAMRWRPAALIALFLAFGAGVLNGLGHLALASNAGGYFPGLATAPLVLAAGCYLAMCLLRSSTVALPAVQ